MKKVVNCPNWTEYDSLSGALMFCSAGAYGKKLTVVEASRCGCTGLKREKFIKAMTVNMGFSLTPEVITEVPVNEAVSGRELIFGMTG